MRLVPVHTITQIPIFMTLFYLQCLRLHLIGVCHSSEIPRWMSYKCWLLPQTSYDSFRSSQECDSIYNTTLKCSVMLFFSLAYRHLPNLVFYDDCFLCMRAYMFLYWSYFHFPYLFYEAIKKSMLVVFVAHKQHFSDICVVYQ